MFALSDLPAQMGGEQLAYGHADRDSNDSARAQDLACAPRAEQLRGSDLLLSGLLHEPGAESNHDYRLARS